MSLLLLNRDRLKRNSSLRKIIDNIGWLFFDKILRMGIGLFVGAWVARYLGPDQFGLVSYAMAIVAMCGSIAGLGLYGIIVRDLVQRPADTYTTLGTAFVLQSLGGLLAFILTVVVISIVRPADDQIRLIVAVLGFAIIFKSADVVKYWFESQVKSKYSVLVENGIFLVMAAARIYLILVQASLMSFVWITLIEAVLVAGGLLLIYKRNSGPIIDWRFNFLRAKALLLESWPLILSAVASMINMRMDQAMLGSMVSSHVVGNYSAAVRLAEVWLMIPSVIGASVYPAIIEAKGISEQLYRYRLLLITGVMAALVVPVATVISIFSDEIILLVFGGQYSSAGSYLSLYIWTGVPYLIFFVVNQMFYIEGLLKIAFAVSVFSLFSNILLNSLLIPLFGGEGAALATLITTICSTLLSLFILNVKVGIFFGRRKN
ncbi:flippase [Ectopseudomonas mendocina]|uniref:Flippase n=1 Tax=Ectopseudomonas mendocina TaxID=300 RepID=A0A2R3QU66_ECTME|nr:flippase [Pseudomonas mendocina]AVO55232.1 flippase [Pseudomonas mendocina]